MVASTGVASVEASCQAIDFVKPIIGLVGGFGIPDGVRIEVLSGSMRGGGGGEGQRKVR